MKNSMWRRVLLGFLIIVLTAGSTPAVAGETAASPDAEEVIESSAAQPEAPIGLDDALRAELQARSAQYDGNYAGTGDHSSNIRIHWPTVIIIVALIIIL